jgi:ATP-dependent DNA ligase
MLYQRTFPAGSIAPCLRIRLYSRPGNDLTYRFPLIVEALARLRPCSVIIDGEAVCCGDDGRPSFDPVSSWTAATCAVTL